MLPSGISKTENRVKESVIAKSDSLPTSEAKKPSKVIVAEDVEDESPPARISGLDSALKGLNV